MLKLKKNNILRSFFKKYFLKTSYLFLLYFKRFEIKQNTFFYKNINNIWLKAFFKFFFKNFKYFSKKKIFQFNLFLIYLQNNYKTIRFFFGYPKTGRTRSNGSNSKQKILIINNVIIKYIYYRYFKKLKTSDHYILSYVEFFNKLWYFQWYPEWINAKIQFELTLKKKYSKWKFGYLLLTLKRPMVEKLTKSKKKINKKKNIEIKNTYNIGFLLGFTANHKDIIKKFHY